MPTVDYGPLNEGPWEKELSSLYKRVYTRGPNITCLYPSVAGSSDSLMSASHQADVMLAPGSHYCSCSCLGQFVWGGVVGGLGVIIESNRNRVRLSCCWVGVGFGCDNTVSEESLVCRNLPLLAGSK